MKIRLVITGLLLIAIFKAAIVVSLAFSVSQPHYREEISSDKNYSTIALNIGDHFF